jgi:hypothetical protein
MSVLVSKIEAISGSPPPEPKTCAPKIRPDPDWVYGEIWDKLLDAVSFLETTERNIANLENADFEANQLAIERLDQSISHLVYVRDLVVRFNEDIPS